jgi:hypothetical protein
MTSKPLAALALVALISAGCGSDTPSGAATAKRTATTDEQPTGQAKAVKFAECIRAHGVRDFPDPDAKGEFQYGVSVTREVWTEAVNACKDMQPAGSLSSKRSPKQQTASLRFAQCVREHGVKDFPDPANGEPLIDTYKIPSSNRPGGMDILNAATAKCRSELGEALADR